MTKYKCKDCGKKELIKQIYTEEVCQSCGFVNHEPHTNKRIRKMVEKQKAVKELTE